MKSQLTTLLLLGTVALVTARLAGVLHLSWLWVLAPIWVPVGLTVLAQTVFPRRRR